MNANTKCRDILIKDRTIGETSPVFIVAEAACNHMCDIDLALKMVDIASEKGADAIKFQTYKAENLVTRNANSFWGNEEISQLDYYKRLDRFGRSEYSKIFSYGHKKGIICFSSPFDEESVDMLNDLNMPVFKIASCDIPNIRLIRHIAKKEKPIIISTGASTTEEINMAIETIKKAGNNQIVLMACTLSYPTKFQDANFLRINTLKEQYPDMLIGLSDHTEPDDGMVAPSIAVALGAKVIEKHFTLDRSMTGSGHYFAVSPSDLEKMVQSIRFSEKLLGDGSLGVSDSEKIAWERARRGIVASRQLRKGEKIGPDMIAMKRPARGLSCSKIDSVIGKKLKSDIDMDTAITMDMIE